MGTSHLQHRSEVQPGDKAWNRTGDKLHATPVRASFRLWDLRHDQREATYNIGPRPIQETWLRTSYLHHEPEVHPQDTVGDKPPATSA